MFCNQLLKAHQKNDSEKKMKILKEFFIKNYIGNVPKRIFSDVQELAPTSNEDQQFCASSIAWFIYQNITEYYHFSTILSTILVLSDGPCKHSKLSSGKRTDPFLKSTVKFHALKMLNIMKSCMFQLFQRPHIYISRTDILHMQIFFSWHN